MNLCKYSLVLYILALLLLVVPVLITLGTDENYGLTWHLLFTNIAIGFLLLGKVLSLIQKRKENKSIIADTSIIVVLFIIFVPRLF
ncbi:hypothetical protein [Paucisalibacillus sp. EB02]|uniref:hypothetical protein n=1 Tax=Paucisalibacillus sp. EB02 TaxID=1347087 RepID=UPI0004BCF162|nr:hypothetical protein [Paucisalibacillus sp. EB02]